MTEWPRVLRWSTWLLVVAILVALPLANTHLGFPLTTSRLPSQEHAWTWHRVSLIAGHALLVLLVVLWARDDGFDLRLSRRQRLGLGLLVAFTAVAAVAVLQKPVEPQRELSDYGSFSRTAQLLSVTSVLWAGLGQEILFRAFAIPVLEQRTGSTAAAVIVTSIAFGYYHGGVSLGAGNLLANIAGGALLALIFVVTRNTWAAAIPHAGLVALLLVRA